MGLLCNWFYIHTRRFLGSLLTLRSERGMSGFILDAFASSRASWSMFLPRFGLAEYVEGGHCKNYSRTWMYQKRNPLCFFCLRDREKNYQTNVVSCKATHLTKAATRADIAHASNNIRQDARSNTLRREVVTRQACLENCRPQLPSGLYDPVERY